MDDECWSKAEWQAINNVWIKYGQYIDSSDFNGNYKIVWSSVTNLLYILVEVTDDAFVDGWPHKEGDFYHFDIIEVFIDQDKSGGLHVFDGVGQTGINWGINAENAFSYHINIDLPASSDYTSECIVNDFAGTGWGDVYHPDYSDHFPEIALRENSGKYYWEFSLKVYSDTYDHSLPEDSRVTLQGGNIIGFSIAYCDNDDIDESPKTRDSFIGSVWVPEEAYNDHWKNADGYGTIKLLTNPVSVPNNDINYRHKLENNSPNPFNSSTQIEYSISKEFGTKAEGQRARLIVNDLLCWKNATLTHEFQSVGNYSISIEESNLPSGICLYKLQNGANSEVKKMIILE